MRCNCCIFFLFCLFFLNLCVVRVLCVESNIIIKFIYNLIIILNYITGEIKLNIKSISFFLICCFFILNVSWVCAFEDNSTEIFLGETIVDEHLLNENPNDTRSDVYLNSSNIVKYYGGSERYGAYLYDDNGDILENKTIKFLINGMEYTRVTDNTGYASMGINLSPGNYSISCFFHGDEYYKPCNRSNWVFVNSTIGRGSC